MFVDNKSSLWSLVPLPSHHRASCSRLSSSGREQVGVSYAGRGQKTGLQSFVRDELHRHQNLGNL